MSSGPLISICIPAYNSEHFIGSTLESVLHQTYSNFEVIVTDDHSTDRTISVVKKFGDRRIRLVENQANLGIAGNWNKALSLATGKYVKVMGADDLLYPDCLHYQIEALEEPANAGAVLAICNSDVINANGQIVLQRRSRFPSGLNGGKELIRNCVRWGANMIGEPVVGLFKRDVLSKSGMFDPANPYMIDLAFWADLLKHGDAFMEPRRLAAFRISPNSVSAKLGLKQAAYDRSFFRKMRADPFYRATLLDLARGYIFALMRCILRNFLIKLRAGAKGTTAAAQVEQRLGTNARSGPDAGKSSSSS
jgi:glycosyltransferase involved in cell wall biosynthesis